MQKFRPAIILVFFFAIFITGLGIYKDFGMSYDEPFERYRGLVTIKYVAEKLNLTRLSLNEKLTGTPKLPYLPDFQDGDHGPLFDLIAVSAEILFNITDDQKIYQSRHLLTFIIFFVGLLAIYKLAERRFSNWRLGLFAVVLMIFTPRLFAEAFYNSKDIVFLALFAVAMNSAIEYLLKPNFGSAFILGFSAALATDVRILGALIPVGVLVALLLPTTFKNVTYRFQLITTLFFLAIYFIVVILLWPWLWHDPLHQVKSAFDNLSKFPVQPPTLYMGKVIAYNNIPWHYVPVWFCITTPILYLLFAANGLTRFFKLLFEKYYLNHWAKLSNIELQDLVFLGFFLGPVCMVIILKSTLYDGWRHLYFIYPAFIIFVLRGLYDFWQIYCLSAFKRLLLIIVWGCTTLGLGAWMLFYHPHQNTYFNYFAGVDRASRFDVDYWGLSGREALERILKIDQRATINLFSDGVLHTAADFSMLNTSDRSRFKTVSLPEDADYLLTNYRGTTFSYRDGKLPESFVLYTHIIVDNEPIFSIYRRVN